MPPKSYTSLIFDIGDVLFTWSPTTKTSISPYVLRKILSSPTWFDYERGKFGECDCYQRVASEFGLDSQEIAAAFQQARDSLAPNKGLIALIRELKEKSNNTLRVYALSNISRPDYEVLRTKPGDWDIFDDIFTSCNLGERKPDLSIYRHVIATTKCDPYRTVFVDDKLENVLSARSLGLCGIVFDTEDRVKRALRNLFGDPISRATDFLCHNAGKLTSMTDNGVPVNENFAQLLILETTRDRSLVSLVEHPKTWNFFQGSPMLTTETFPFDLDTTSLGITVCNPAQETAMQVMDEMLQFVNGDGIIQTYFDHNRPRFDPVVCVNALCLFYAYGRGAELALTLEWVHEVLLHRAYLEGTRYYESAECFLYFIMRFLQMTEDEEVHNLLQPLLKERIQERIGGNGDALALAMRIIVCDYVGVRDEVDLQLLLPLQCEDGGWEIGWIYKYGSSGIKLGNRGLTTAIARKAVELISVERTAPPSPSSTVVASLPAVKGITPLVGETRKRHRRSDSLRNSLQWLLQVSRRRKSMDSI